MISYYELLGMIKDLDIPEKYPKEYWHNNCREKVLYVPSFDYVSRELEGYHIQDRNLESEDVRYWLSECMLESSMFDKCLELIEEEKKIEKLDKKHFKKKQRQLANKINEIIDVINKQD